MIEFVEGDLFESGCEALVNPVNCIGVMGKGLALQFKQRYPRYFTNYKWQCDKGLFYPGRVFLYTLMRNSNPLFVISVATKDHWRNPSKLEWVENGLKDLCEVLVLRNVKSVAVPALGAGLGGLPWMNVKPLMAAVFSKHPDILFKVYEPHQE
jgi:O-acetyl-ADP-ribose deacetylase (regulator of RNase III)